jgi:hypothetical protein
MMAESQRFRKSSAFGETEAKRILLTGVMSRRTVVVLASEL